MTVDLARKLNEIADASRRQDGTDIPLGGYLREAASQILDLRYALGLARERMEGAMNAPAYAVETLKMAVDEIDGIIGERISL